MSKRSLSLCICAVVMCIQTLAVPSASAVTIYESYENGFGPWRPAIANPPVAWRVTPSRAQVLDGAWSLDFTADGTNDDGQLFMVRELELPAGTWDIDLQFNVYSFTEGMINAWNAIGFIGPYQPTTEADFTQSSWGERIGAITVKGWSTFSIQRTITSGIPTKAYVVFGYDIVWETQRTYYFDSVTLTGVPIQCGNGSCFEGEDRCNCPTDCGTPPGTETTCDNGADDDCDGLADCADSDCSAFPACAGVVCDGDLVCEAGEESCICHHDCGPPPIREFVCDDGYDDDCDGQTDCDDFLDCGFHPVCMGTGDCDFDGTCETGEDCTNCPSDCFSGSGAICGNGVCEIGDGEDCLSCASDCNGKQGGKPANRYCCGNGPGENPVDCVDARCTGDGNTCTAIPAAASCCGDTVCEGSEDGFNCAIDCGAPPVCGDDNCDPGEDQCGCPADCGTPPATEANCTDEIDNDCDGDTDCADCDGGPACPSCLPKGAACSADSECCSVKCRGGSCK